MTNSCPLCGSPLSAARFAKVWKEHRGIQRQIEKLKAAQKRADEEVSRARQRVRDIQVRARAKTARAREEERRRAEGRLHKYQATAKRLRDKVTVLEDRIRRGETAQTEGLLEERALLAFLREHFREDRFEHVGKGGDIIQDVCAPRGQRAGRIVYEVKKEETWKSKNILQAAEARIKREANLAVLVTNRFPAKRQYYFVEREVLVISPQGILPLIHTAREGLLAIHALNVSGEQKQVAVRAVYEYLAGGTYIAHIKKVAQHFQDLESLFHKEVHTHQTMWGNRLNHYKGILSGVSSVHEKLRGVIAPAVKVGSPKLASASALLPPFVGPEGIQRITPR
ncbi:MAG: DUF2130 domain-containing protein [Sulfuricaulis sp.]|uniref:DUF2130 domain-containing protein n=1 Tax=Sulfuricaulis sp. TaxID=2003553 RepID=UPI0034A21848